ncbi:MAG: DUF2798 domain-containing protein [Alphaproteobacteria bacterium]|nr:DUF2798 domain-containing protein [Alphaproteobacteria bacterium]MBU0859638.1 DUF2798 domain-containing protein [Alphaproteobacteria bacterium]
MASKFRKLPARTLPLALPFVISIIMSCVVSGVATFHNIGLPADFIASWMSAWVFSWVIAFPTLLVVMPVARRIVFLFVENPASKL